jgi:hypothetical protein
MSDMATNYITKIARLFHDREQIEVVLSKLGYILDRLEDEGRTDTADFRELAGYFADLSNRLAAVDKQIAKAKARNAGDKFIIAMVAQWRDEQLDRGLAVLI